MNWNSRNTVLLISLAALMFPIGTMQLYGQSTPPWWYKNTGQNHTILIPELIPVLINDIAADSGDYIGVFYDSLGTEACGGYVVWQNETTALSAWGEDEGNDGFKPGEEFRFKIWDASEGKALQCLSAFNGEDFPSFNTYQSNGMSGLDWLNAYPDTTYVLHPGWNLFCPAISHFYSIDSLLSPFEDKIELIRDFQGGMWNPSENLFQIDYIDAGKVYEVKTTDEVELPFFGHEKNQAGTELVISAGFSIFPYYLKWEYPVTEFFQTDVDQIRLIADDDGNLYWPEFGIESLANFNPFRGYRMVSFGEFSFTVPAGSPNPVLPVEDPPLVYFSGITPTNNCMYFAMPLSAWDSLPLPGDEVAVCDLSGRVFGAGVYSAKDLAFVVWGDDPHTSEKDGLKSFEPFRILLWRQNTGFDDFVNIASWSEGDSLFVENRISIVDKVKKTEEISGHDFELNVYRDDESLLIEWSLPRDIQVLVELYAVSGKRIDVVYNQFGSKGKYREAYDRILQPGVYLLTLQAAERMITKRFVVY